MLSFLARLFDTSGFPARWNCGLWSDELGWLHIASDAAIFAAYVAIPVVLACFVLRRPDVPFPRIFWLFFAFILACGIGHLVEAIIFWQPVYRLAGVVKLFTALLSWATVIALVRVVPLALQYPGLAKVNAELRRSNEELRQLTDDLQMVRQKSADAETVALEKTVRIQAILDGATDAIITIRADGAIESFNGAAERMFGYHADEVIGRNISMLMPPPYRDEHDRHLVNYLHTGESKIIGVSREVVGLRADGSSFPMDLAVSEVKLGDRRMFTGIIRDISKLKRALEQLGEANLELKERARQIERFNVDLNRSNEELAQFAYVASHDLQEPLRKVTAFCQMLADEYSQQLDDNARQYIRYAVDGAVRMKTLVQDLLQFSRVETQGKPLEPTDADDACAIAIENLAAAIEESAAEVTREPLPSIQADHAQLERLFQNLIGNAIKYRSVEPPRIHITAADDGEQWILRVRDNGIGIDPQYHERIFVIFQRLHARDEYSGTGIGLAVCKRIVERFGGRIWVESQEGAGSVFCMTFPKSVGISTERPDADSTDGHDVGAFVAAVH